VGMRRMLPITAVLSALVLATPPAHAGKIADTKSAGPLVLAGNTIFYSVNRQSDQAARVRLARPGHESKLVFSQHLFRGYRGEPTMTKVAASSQRVGVLAFQERGDIESSSYSAVNELWTGRVTGPLKLVATTRGKTGCAGGIGTPAVAENRLVTVESACLSGARIVVREYARKGTPRTIARASRIKALTAAGHFAAWVQRDRRVHGHWTYSIVVYDLARGRVAHRIANGGWADFLTVQADSKVAGQTFNGPLVTAWYPKTGQTRHVLPEGSFVPPRLGADRLLYYGNFGPTGEAALALRDLDGTQKLLVIFPGRTITSSSLSGFADYDGRRVAFLQPGCAGNELWLLDANGPAYTAPQAPTCPSAGSR
jgi:hypothetical protein